MKRIARSKGIITAGTAVLIASTACSDAQPIDDPAEPIDAGKSVVVSVQDSGRAAEQAGQKSDASTHSADKPMDIDAGTSDPGSSEAGVDPIVIVMDPGDAGELPEPTSSADSGSQMESVVEPTFQHCIYTTPPDEPAPTLPDAGEVVHVSVRGNAFVGDYLVDALGKPLYIYTADLPGDCESAPQSVCIDNCVASWPAYDATERNLGEGLAQDSFGTITRTDGIKQSTYLGWPLYTFKSDNKPEVPDGFISGHGKRGLWMAARVNPYNIVVMVPESDAKARYLASGSGRTLYSYDQDTVGTADAAPMSACVGQCRAGHPPVRLAQVTPVGGLLPEDFSIFARTEGGGAQLAYQGKPLYWSVNDATRGEINGEGDGWQRVEP